MQATTGVIDASTYRLQNEPSLFATEKPELGRDEFMQLLVAQLENQDPMNPQDDSEFVAQLATFSSLEQLVDMNKRMDSMLDSQAQLVNSQSLNLIGREVLADTGGQVQLRSDGVAETVVVDLAETVTSARVEIYDSHGGLLRTLAVDDPGPGRHQVQWDGLDENGNAMTAGMYEFRVVTQDGEGLEQQQQGFVLVPVEGLHVGANGLAFVSGNRVMTFDEVLEIRVGETEAEPVEESP
ncbi:MAG: flagellar hook assembly protein FlgD [Acidobacteriota bacterium]|nr:flagellar hook assembly protein FlgD [Acidobacteriota bacterium]MDQ7088954.1 flagellar hook assembly protein FlgD [Acidobacteriota bacterium]